MKSAVSAMCVVLAPAMSSCGGGDRAPGSADASAGETEPVDPTAGRSGSLADDVVESCVESYTPTAVADRAFAFEGVVIDIGQSVSDRGDGGDLSLPGVTFQVNQWFEGGDGSIFTVDLQAPEGSYGIGSRLLVSGESRWGEPDLTDAIAWGCGFTRYYDAETAQSWENAF
jgi:hypothetical protein